MIAITKEILGPGIQEEYADALSRINSLLSLLEPFPETNDTAEGRVKLELQWLKQEIEEEHLAFPVDRRFIATLLYVMTEGSLDHLPNFAQLADELATVLEEGLVKPRHYPVVAAMITDAVDKIPASAITPRVTRALDDLKTLQTGLLSGSIRLPLSKEDWSLIREIAWEDIPGIPFAVVKAMFALDHTLFAGARPDICQKGLLPAPKPGLRVDLSKSRR